MPFQPVWLGLYSILFLTVNSNSAICFSKTVIYGAPGLNLTPTYPLFKLSLRHEKCLD
jgi:hypothetical protein